MNYKKTFHLDIHHVSNPKKFGDNYLFQIGRYFSSTNAELLFDLHPHPNFYELTLVLDGEGTITTNNVAVKIKKNDLFLTIPTDIHKIESDKSFPLKYDFISFNTDNQNLKIELKKIALKYLQPDTRVFKSEQIQTLVDLCITDMIEENNLHQETMNSALTLIIAKVANKFLAEDKIIKQINPNKKEQLCYLMMDYINSHIFSIKKLEELGEYFNYSYPYLSSVFAKHCQQKLSDYYQFQRLEKAKELISIGQYSLTDISEKLNYSSIYSFSKAFKNQYGIPPSQWKNDRTY